VIEPLLALPAHVRERLAQALRTGLLAPPYGPAAISGVIGETGASDGVIDAMAKLQARGVSPAAISLVLDAATAAAAQITRPELVWTGPEVPGLHARDTARVYEELVAAASRSLWISTFTYYDGPKAFRTLAQRMDAVPELRVSLLLNIGRARTDGGSPAELAKAFSERLWRHDWPGERRPAVFYDPRALDPGVPGAVLHAKAVIADEQVALVTSANLTEAAFERNIEAGVLSRDAALATALVVHFRTLIDRQLLLPLP